MTMPHHRRRAPPWWPANQRWPPSGAPHMRWRGRSRFIRRIAIVFAAMLFFSTCGIVTIVSVAIGGGALAGLRTQISPAAIALVSGILMFGVLLAVVRRVGIPLGDLVDAANRVADGDFTTRVREHGPPSLRMVGGAFNSMAARLQAQEQQRRHLMADIAHELRTPLSVIQGRLEGFLDGVYPRDDARVGEVLEETRLLARLVEDLRTLANAESGALALHKEPTDVAALAHDVINAFSADVHDRHVSLSVDAPADLPPVVVDPLRIREVLTNVVSNALHHTPAGGRISIAARVDDARIIVSVRDTGSGIAPEDLPKIFDRFHKAATSHGSGLGLTIARNLVQAHGGEIRAESAVGEGTTITITLPTAQALATQ
jgi:signal transduction histidine kinase